MSWTTSAPYRSKSISRQATNANAVTTPPPDPSPKVVPKPLALVTNSGTKPRTPISPQKLAKLANALGVSTPAPASVPYPLYSPTTSSSSAFGSSTPSRYLLHVIPPLHLLLAEPDDANDSYAQDQFRRGTLIPLYPTLPSQLGAIAREYSLPSTGGLILYLITTDNEPGPRLTDDAWRMLWHRALQRDKDGSSNGKTIARFHSRSVASSTSVSNSPYPSPSSEGRFGSEITPASSSTSLDLAINLNPSSALPILAKVEFDIDRRKAQWYPIWRHRRRTTSHSVDVPSQFDNYADNNNLNPRSTRELQLPLRARSTSPSLAEWKAKFTSELNSSADSDEAGQYVRLDDEMPRRGARMRHMGQFTDDPLHGVFPSDSSTWAQMRQGSGRNGKSSKSPHTPDIMVGGQIGSSILTLDEDDEESVTDDTEDVLKLWKDKRKQTLDPVSPSHSASTHGGRSRSASKHIPPPLDLSSTSKSQIPHVEVAPPSASPSGRAHSDLPYLGSAGGGVPPSEEARSRGLDELERVSLSGWNVIMCSTSLQRIESLSPNSQWESDDAFSPQQKYVVESPTIVFDSEETNADR